MNLPHIESLVLLSDDAAIQTMCAANGKLIASGPPPGPNDTAIFFLEYDGYKWLVMRFFDPQDPGYLAYGLPLVLSYAEMEPIWTVIMAGMAEDAFQHTGQNPFEYSQYTNFSEPEAN